MLPATAGEGAAAQEGSGTLTGEGPVSLAAEGNASIPASPPGGAAAERHALLKQVMQPVLDSRWPVQAGFSASTRKFPHAADRNRVKRLTRECWRLQKQGLYDFLNIHSCHLAVFFVYTDKKIASFDTLHHKISVILKKLQAEIKPA